MDKETKRVLLFEDEDIGEDIKRAFEMEECVWKFDVTWVRDVESLIDRTDPNVEFDIAVVDLWSPVFHNNPAIDKEAGLLPVRHVRLHSPFGLRVVYTGHSVAGGGLRYDTCVKAMREGADDFVGKDECTPRQLVKRVVERLREKEGAEKENGEFQKLRQEKASEWRETYAGKVIAVAGETVVGVGDSELEAALNAMRTHERSVKPHFIKIEEV